MAPQRQRATVEPIIRNRLAWAEEITLFAVAQLWFRRSVVRHWKRGKGVEQEEHRHKRKRPPITQRLRESNVTDVFSSCASLCSFSLQVCLSAWVTACQKVLASVMVAPAAEP